MIDFHIHTPLCNHAKGSMVKYIEEAIKKNIKEICFLDHLMLIEDSFLPSMFVNEVEFYFLSVSELKRRYKDRIKIRVGLEVDFFEDWMEEIENIISKYDFDVIAGSSHYIEVEGKTINIASRRAMKNNGDIPVEVIRRKYINKIMKMLDHDIFRFLCHLDLVNRFYPSEGISDFLPVLDKIKEKNRVVEINTGGFNYINKCQNPETDIIRECYKRGIQITMGSDSHKPHEVAQNFEKTILILKEVGYREIVSFEKGKKTVNLI